MAQSLLEAIRERPLLGDGAMGTQLQAAGLVSGGCGEFWNVAEPEKVEAIQRRYVEAGSDILITNTFGGCRITLARYDHGDKVAEINRASVAIARRAFGEKPGFVVGDIGPFGGLLEPLGEHTESDVREAFAQQAGALVEAGADAVIVETQTSFEEAALGIEAAKKAGAPCVIISFAYDVTRDNQELRTMMGIDPDQAAAFVAGSEADIIALNCGTGVDMKWAAHTAARYAKACDLPIMAQPNAGQPELEGVTVVYRQTPEEMAAGMDELHASGARILGGCCGSTPEHIAEMRRTLDAIVEN
jgi:5-methyltetrahydrofolate--homocysteine methyltransferase